MARNNADQRQVGLKQRFAVSREFPKHPLLRISVHLLPTILGRSAAHYVRKAWTDLFVCLNFHNQGLNDWSNPMSSVMTVIAGAKLRITEATLNDGKLVTGKTIEVGKDNFQPPPLWMPPQGLRSVENIGSVTYHAYQIELKSEKKAD